MKHILVAAALLASVPALAQNSDPFGGFGQSSMNMTIKIDVRFRETSPNFFNGQDADVSMELMGTSQSARSPIEGSITVLSKNQISIVSKTESGNVERKVRAAIERDRNGDIRSIRVAEKEFSGPGGSIFSVDNGAGQMASIRSGSLICKGSGHELRCKQTIVFDMMSK